LQTVREPALLWLPAGIKRLTIESTRQDIIPIQMLRGIAASMVVFVHLDVQLKRLGYGTLDAPWLASGVDIFFVISGFHHVGVGGAPA
jgi:peptidoglycan/LPS O-acetylase OafA/YrhL